MIYNLGKYRYKNFKIYEQIWWIFYKCIDKGLYGVDVGIRKVNELCGIKEEEVDYSKLILLPISNEVSGKFLTNFKESNNYYLNDPLPAVIKPYNNRLDIQWENGHSCVIDASYINIYKEKE